MGLLEEEGLSNWKATEAVNKSEWFNQIRTIETLFGPYELQEDIHPNYWAQLGLRNCLTQAYNAGTPKGGTCTTSGIGPELGGRAEHVAALSSAQREPGGEQMRSRARRGKLRSAGEPST